MCAVDESFENFLGARSRHGTQVTQACIEEADCVILVGSSLTAISNQPLVNRPQKRRPV